jgi:hypothetical protein
MAFKYLLLALIAATTLSGCYVYDGDDRYDRGHHQHRHYDHDHGFRHW